MQYLNGRTRRRSARASILGAALLLVLAGGGTTTARAQSAPSPSIRGVVIGGGYDLFQPLYRPHPSGVLPAAIDPIGGPPSYGFSTYTTNWWFGYRPDIPQKWSDNTEVPMSYGPDGLPGTADDLPDPNTHAVYSPLYTPINAYDNHSPTPLPTPYDRNTGLWPGCTVLSVVVAPVLPFAGSPSGDPLFQSISGSHWGGFYGVLRGSMGARVCAGFPWSSPGRDFGGYNPADPFGTAQSGPANLFIYDIEGIGSIPHSTPTITVAAGGSTLRTYDLTSTPDLAADGVARGRISLRRKDFSANYIINPATLNNNTAIIQGLWVLDNVEGSFLYDPVKNPNGIFTTADIGKAVGAWGQPEHFFAGLNYNDNNFRDDLHNAPEIALHLNLEKYLVYQFLPAALQVVRTYDFCSNQYCVSLQNTGDVDLYNVSFTDPLAPAAAPLFKLAAGDTHQFYCGAPNGTPLSNPGTANASSSIMRIERAPDRLTTPALDPHGTYNIDPAKPFGTYADGSEPTNTFQNTFVVSASSPSVTVNYGHCEQICVSLYVDAACAGGEPVSNQRPLYTGPATFTLTGTDIVGNTVTPQTMTTSNGTACFTGLLPGTYTVSYAVPTGFHTDGAFPGDGGTKLNDTSITVVAATPGKTNYSPQEFQICPNPGSVCAQVVCDNGAPMGSVPVTLLNGNTVVATQNTDSNGNVCFNNLQPGSYTLSVPSPTSADGKDLFVSSTVGNGSPTSSSSPLVTITSDSTTSVLFTYKGGSVAGTVYCQAGTLTTPQQGVTVTLMQGTTTVASMQTDANGQYLFKGCLPAGSYTVSVPSTFNGNPIVGSSSQTTTMAAGQDIAGLNFSYNCGTHTSGGNGATRTWGFWKTHLAIFTQAVNAGCVNLGTLQCTSQQTGGAPTTETPNSLYSGSALLGYYEGVFQTDPGAAKTALGQARLQLAHQLIAAQANVCLIGTQPQDKGFSPTLLADALAALDGTNATTILSFVSSLDSFNTSGDPIALANPLSEGKADPNGAKKAATLPIPGYAFK